MLVFTGLNAQNLVDENGLKQGKWAKKYDWGTIRYTGEFQDDKEIGTFRFFDQNGKILSIREYKSPGGIAVCTMYDHEENLHASGELLGMKKLGTWLYYSNDGKDTIGVETFVDGLLHGAQYTYFENGNITEIMHFNKGNKEGEWIEYYSDGQINVKGQFINNQLNGKVTYYYSTGERRKIGNYTQGIRKGIWLTYDISGKVIKKVDYDKLVNKTRPIRR